MGETLKVDRSKAAEELHRRLISGTRPKSRARRMLLSTTWILSTTILATSKRLFDFCLALLLLTASSPIWILHAVAGERLNRTARVGRWAQTFHEYSFPPDGVIGRVLGALHLLSLPALLNILRGEMSFIGPRAADPGEISPRGRIARRRYDVRPGLICLWWVRQRANIAFESEAQSDLEYVESQTVSGDFALALRAIPAMLYGEGVANAPDEFSLAGIRINNLTMTEAIETIVQWSEAPVARQVAFVNADSANIAWRNPRFSDALQHCDLTLGDGIGIKLAAKALGLHLKQNVNGTDLFPRLCDALQGRSGGLYLLGARPQIAETVANWAIARYPKLKIAGFRDGYFNAEEEPRVLEQIGQSGASVLLLALGAPNQELWIRRNLEATGAKVAIGVGGLFDFYSGRISRAPQWLREMGLEWTYRLYQEPGRMWRRYLVGNITFLYHIALERLRS